MAKGSTPAGKTVKTRDPSPLQECTRQVDVATMIVGRYSPERMVKIFKENLKLVQRIHAIETRQRNPKEVESVKHTELNRQVICTRMAETRARDQKRIRASNLKLLDKIKHTAPSRDYSRAQMAKDWEVSRSVAFKMSRTKNPQIMLKRTTKLLEVSLGTDTKYLPEPGSTWKNGTPSNVSKQPPTQTAITPKRHVRSETGSKSVDSNKTLALPESPLSRLQRKVVVKRPILPLKSSSALGNQATSPSHQGFLPASLLNF